MKVIVGTNELWPTPNVASKILSLMLSTDEDFGVRARINHDYTSGIEELTAKIGDRLDRRVICFVPTDSGSSTAFKRDVRLVKAASGVYAFFGAEGPVEGGTAHVVACALRERIPVVAYGLDNNGDIIEIGQDAGEFYHNTGPAFIWNAAGLLTMNLEEIGWRK